MFDFAEKTENMLAIEILNYYRNLYYDEPQVTERGIVANAINDVLDLINRQKSEIERLKECPKCVYEYDGEVTEYCVQGPCQNFKTVEQIKAEAYKEFAEKIKKSIKENVDEAWHRDDGNGIYDAEYVLDDIDNLLKEMAGDGQ